jgi:hypothetical protein
VPVEVGLGRQAVEPRGEPVEVGVHALGVGHDLLRDGAQAVGDLGLVGQAAVDEPGGPAHPLAEGIGPAVVEAEAELLQEGAKVGVVGVDERAAEVVDDPGLDQALAREHPPADPAAGFVDRGLQAVLSELPGGVEPGDAGADDGDARVAGAAERQARRQAEAARGEGGAEEPAAAEPGCGHGAVRGLCLAERVPQAPRGQTLRHPRPPSAVGRLEGTLTRVSRGVQRERRLTVTGKRDRASLASRTVGGLATTQGWL